MYEAATLPDQETLNRILYGGPTNPEGKKCTRCKHIKTQNIDNFPHDPNSEPDPRDPMALPLADICRACFVEMAGIHDRMALSEAVKQVDLQNGERLVKRVRQGLNDKEVLAAPHAVDTFKAIVEAFGGPEGIANCMLATFSESTPKTKASLLKMMLDMNMKLSDDLDQSIPLEEMTDEAIDDEIKLLIDVQTANNSFPQVTDVELAHV